VRGTSRRLTAEYWAGDPLWSPDGQTLAYSIAADSPPNIVVRGGAGDAPERRLTRHGSEQHYATGFTPDARQIVFHAATATTGLDLYLVSTTEDHAPPQRLLQTRANESQGRVSPDGRWLAYVSDESGRPEVYLSRFPELQGTTAVSSGGGRRPAWRRDGRELFYLAPDGSLVAVPLTPDGGALEPGKPFQLFAGGVYEGAYAVDSAGQRFLVARVSATTETVPLEVVINPLSGR
jgi:Tol biopolymer transport system component